MISAMLAAFIGWGFYQITQWELADTFLMALFNIFVVVALVEEVLKYLVVKVKVLSSPELDEPLDVMLYMIIAALGFAALENILLFLSPKVFFLPLGETLGLVGFRWISATFLHALASGILGYFLALSFFRTAQRRKFLFYGIFLATLLHGLYDLSIIKFEGDERLIIPIIILVGSAIFVSFGFRKLKNMRSVCKIKISNNHK